MAVPFSMSVAGLWKKNAAILSEHAFPWLLFSVAVLGSVSCSVPTGRTGSSVGGGTGDGDPVRELFACSLACRHRTSPHAPGAAPTNAYIRTNFASRSRIISACSVPAPSDTQRVLGDASSRVHRIPAHRSTGCARRAGRRTAVSAALLVLAAGSSAPMKKGGGSSRGKRCSAGGHRPPPERCGHTFRDEPPILSRPAWNRHSMMRRTFRSRSIITILIGYSLFMQWEVQDGPYTFSGH